MNIAFGAVILLLLLIPGLLFRIAYLSVRYSGKSFKSTFIDETLLALAPAFILQVGGFLFVEKILGKSVNLSLVYQLVTGSPSFNQFAALKQSFGSFLLYCLLLWSFSCLVGFGIRKLVKWAKLDYRYPIFRFQNDWYPILKGTILRYPDYQYLNSKIGFVWIDVVLETKEGSYIYSGIVKDFFLSKDDGLDRIYLTNVRRRKLSDDRMLPEEPKLETGTDANLDSLEPEIENELDNLDKRYYYMPGDFFIIPYAQIRNINITYNKLDEEE